MEHDLQWIETMENITKLINQEFEYSAIKQKQNKNPT